MAINLKVLRSASWILGMAGFILGLLGYIQPLGDIQWSRTVSWVLLITFCVITVGEWLVDAVRDRHSAQEFYEQERTEVFYPPEALQRMQFFTDNGGNKCVTFVLEYEPIPESIHLWEGGYHAPPITLVVKGPALCFRHSAYSSQKEYHEGVPLYQVRYFPKTSKATFPKHTKRARS